MKGEEFEMEIKNNQNGNAVPEIEEIFGYFRT